MQDQGDFSNSKNDEYDNEPCLLHWDRWKNKRKKQTKILGEKTDRPQADLTMNLLSKVRSDKERKTVLEDAQQLCEKPTIRGNLWEQPLRLKQPCYCKPVYEVHRTPNELGRPPIVEHIGVPKYIQSHEMGMAGDSRRQDCKTLDYEYEQYRKRREDELKEKIIKIDPFRPDLSNLMIKGSKPKTPPKKMPPLPVIAIITSSEPARENLSAVYALRLNNTLFVKDIHGQDTAYLEKIRKEQWNEKCTSWSYYFNTPAKRAGRSKLYLENLGTVTIRYCWKKIRKQIPFIPEDNNEQVFFFNKNEDVIFPGHTKEIWFTFISDQPGVYSEFWELSTCNLCFFDTLTDKLTVNLYGDAVEPMKMINKKIDKLKRKINNRTIYGIVLSIVNEAIDRSTTVEPEIYPYKKYFLEAELFVMKNPVCFYHQTEVEKMKGYYNEMVKGKEWDLSIGSWRSVMMAKEFDERMYYFGLLKKSHADFLKPWYEGEDVLLQKYRAMNLVLNQLADKFDSEYDSLTAMYTGVNEQSELVSPSQVQISSATACKISNVFYVRMYDHVCDTIEECAGILSSIDLNRWIEFDFCRW